jgi:glycosyltransferase involved in cell wall biosynthesis
VKPVKYIAITPARDEELFLPDMIASMVAQSVLPARWIIIDDGSDDRTGEIIDKAAREHPWIEPKHLPSGRKREPGGESVIMRFLPKAIWQDADYIVRFDSDLLFDRDYVERLLAEFERDPKLGIVSGCLVEPENGEWRANVIPSFHTRGPSKIYSRACFEAIGGLESGLGWDTIDEVKAMMQGFKTKNFRHINAYHRRTTASARGLWRGRYSQGLTAYYLGYSHLFSLARAAGFTFKNPPILGPAVFLAGFYSGYLYRLPRRVDREVAKFIRTEQFRRLTFRESVWH